MRYIRIKGLVTFIGLGILLTAFIYFFAESLLFLQNQSGYIVNNQTK